MSKDLSHILDGWDHNPNEVTVRRITGEDGGEKLQMRLDLGVLQMELEGRPDGRRPHGYESLYEYLVSRRERHISQHGSVDDWEVSSEDCSDLRQESMQYYYRYLSLFHLGDYLGVMRDTSRNLKAFDLIRDFAADDSDRSSLEQFRPYVMMMHTRARACLSLEERDFDLALRQIDEGIARIEEFFREVEREDFIENSREIEFLRDWSERIRSNRPLTPAERLRQELRVAVEAEDYERAAQLRDEIKEMAVA
ncbi:MAG TPA: UvrB/UvrC motif-containing protein [Abditibacteriaceae bacterium]|jgi:hypothetical protein